MAVMFLINSRKRIAFPLLVYSSFHYTCMILSKKKYVIYKLRLVKMN